VNLSAVNFLRSFLYGAAILLGIFALSRAGSWIKPDFRTERAAAATRSTSGHATSDEPSLPTADWTLLRALNTRTGQMSERLARLNGRRIRIAGYMVPLEDDLRVTSEFLLVPYVGACVHTPAPPPNQIVLVTMPEGRPARVESWEPVWVSGDLRVQAARSPYGPVSFQMSSDRVEPY
jgi:hypothetical protein